MEVVQLDVYAYGRYLVQIVSGVLECVKQSSLVQYVQDNHQIAVTTWKSNNIKDQGISMAFKGLNFSYSTYNYTPQHTVITMPKPQNIIQCRETTAC